MAGFVPRIGLKLMSVAVGIPVGIATKKAVEGTWAAARPGDRPRRAHETGVRWIDAVGWGALSAVGVVVADLVTRRGAEEVWRTVIGTEPPPPKPSRAEKKMQKAREKAGVVES